MNKQRSKAEASNWSVVWLKGLLQELQEENGKQCLIIGGTALVFTQADYDVAMLSLAQRQPNSL